jgi:hypothetical protein
MKKTALMCLVIVLAFGGLGVGYAHWSDYLYVDGTVEMGTLTLAFDAEEFLDYIDIEEATGDKDIGSARIYYDPDSYILDEHSGKEGYKTLVFEILNAYPQYEVHFTTVVLHNIGTIPIHIVGIKLWDPDGVLNWEWEEPPPTTPSYGFFWKDKDGDGAYDPGEEEIMNVLIKNFVCIQLEPCESTKGEIDIDFKQPAEECHTYRFMVEFEGIQWNKYVPPVP